MDGLSRRTFLGAVAASTVAVSISKNALAEVNRMTWQPVAAPRLHWLEGRPAGAVGGTTFTMAWPRGELAAGVPLRAGDLPLQTSPLAYWPDGSIKWTMHAIPPCEPAPETVLLEKGEPAVPAVPLKVETHEDTLVIDTGRMRTVVNTAGERLIESIERAGRPTLRNARLVVQNQNVPHVEESGSATVSSFTSSISKASVENVGPVRACIKVEGVHTDGTKKLLPFIVRFYFYAGSDEIRIVHTFIYEVDEYADFIRGIGIRFDVPMSDPSHDRHVRFVGEGHGLWGEAVRGITGLRRDPGEAVRKAQVAGLPTPPPESWDRRVTDRLHLIPEWGDVSLSQLTADGFTIRKRTKPGCAWVHSAAGTRAGGVGYVGGISGGVLFGMRDFWQKFPVQLDIRNAHTDTAGVTIWIYSPEAPAMDTRFYHDGMGMNDSYQEQIEGLNITYEDYEPGYGTPSGIARTTELSLKVCPATPAREAIVSWADAVRTPPLLVADPQRYLDAAVFGALWTLPDRSTPTRRQLEDELDYSLEGYLAEVGQRRWYGFWDYGDVMHSYDSDRHQWRYDVGGYGWDNSELSPDLWLWYAFMRSGRADVYRLAEAMTRHTGEVDTYHSGRFKFLGTRHNVQHWGCSSKQIRISTAVYRRHFYFLTGDERTGDLLRQQLEANETQKKIIIGRKLAPDAPVLPLPPVENPGPRGGDYEVGPMGYGHTMIAWLTEAERTNDPAWHKKLVNAMQGLSKLPFGFFSSGWTLNLDTGEIKHDGNQNVGVSHLTACFGLPETCAELVLTYGDDAKELARTWAHYGRLYNAGGDVQRRELGSALRGVSLQDTHSRCTAFAAWFDDDAELARRAWDEFLGRGPASERGRWMTRTKVEGPDVLEPIVEYRLGTNGAAQRGLSIMQNLALVGKWLDA